VTPDSEDDRPTLPSMPPPSTHACDLCGAPLRSRNTCQRCWELYHRLEDFRPWMNTKAGRDAIWRVASQLASMLLFKRGG